jgi:cytochrome P450
VSVLNFLSEEVRRNPYPIYDQLRGMSPVLHDPRSDLWMIFDYDGVKQALNDTDTFSSRAAPSGGAPLDWFIFLDPPRHTKLRALVMRAFTPRSVANLERRIRELSGELLDRAIPRGQMDLAADFSVPLPLMVIAEMLGIPLADQPQFRCWTDIILNLIYTVTGGDEAARAVREFGTVKTEMNGYLGDLLAQRRAAPKDDLLTRLLQAEVDGERLTDKDILSFFQLLLLAGSETTTNLRRSRKCCAIARRSR